MLLQVTNATVIAIFVCRVVTQPDQKFGKKKIGARRIRTFESGGIANYQKIIKKFKTMIKIIKIIKNF